jgi:hypothetical protein
MRGRRLAGFFIVAAFATSRGPGADEAKAVTALGEHDRQKPACLRVAEKYRAGLCLRGLRVPCLRALVTAFSGSHSSAGCAG